MKGEGFERREKRGRRGSVGVILLNCLSLCVSVLRHILLCQQATDSMRTSGLDFEFLNNGPSRKSVVVVMTLTD